jgi:hypothetical protein
MKTLFITLEETIAFLKDYVIECLPSDGRQRCNEAREIVKKLESELKKLEGEL